MNEFKTPSTLVKRDLDGIYLRVQIAGKWENRCLTDLVWEDVEFWLGQNRLSRTAEDHIIYLRHLAKHLHNRLRTLGDQLDLATKTEDEE